MDVQSVLEEFESEKMDTARLFDKINDLQISNGDKIWEHRLYRTIKKLIPSSNVRCKISVINLVYKCVMNDICKSEKYIDLVFDVVAIAANVNMERIEGQELFIKSISVLLLMDELLIDVCKMKCDQFTIIFKKVFTSNVPDSCQKREVLKLYSKLAFNIDVVSIRDQLLEVWYLNIFPLMFSCTNEALQKDAIDESYRLFKLLSAHIVKSEQWMTSVFQFEKQYTDVMLNLIKVNNVLFARIWIFIIQLIKISTQKVNPFNMILNVVESAFKSQNFNIRKNAFRCWQELIKCFELTPTELIRPKRIELFLKPLRSNNCTTENVAEEKFNTFCVLLNLLAKYKTNTDVIETFLTFCFVRPRTKTDQPQAVVCKKYISLYSKCSQALLQMIGDKRFMLNDLQSHLDVLALQKPILSAANFSACGIQVVGAVRESCVMLCSLSAKNQDADYEALNYALWGSLFFIVDELDEDVQREIADEVEHVVERLKTHATTKSQTRVSFIFETIFSLICSNDFEFIKNRKICEDIFFFILTSELKSDETILKCDVSSLCIKMLMYKRSDKNLLAFIYEILTKLFNNESNTSVLQTIWFALQEEILECLKKKGKADEKIAVDLLHKFLSWPVKHLKQKQQNNNSEDVIPNWKNIYTTYNSISSNNQQKMKLANLLLKDMASFSYPSNNKVTVANLAQFIILNIDFNNYLTSKDNDKNVIGIVEALKEFLSVLSLPSHVLDLYVICFAHFLQICHKLTCLDRVFPLLNACLKCLVNIHKRFDVLNSVITFINVLDVTVNLIPDFEKLLTFLKSLKREKHNILENIEKLYETKLPNNKPKANSNKNDEIFVATHTPPRKLNLSLMTPHQKEMFSKRCDDIPALYEDLSRSQSQSLCSKDQDTCDESTRPETASPRPFIELNKITSDTETNVRKRKLDDPIEMPNSDVEIKRRKRKSRLENELARIQISVNDKQEFKRNDKRSTRWLGTFEEELDESPFKVPRTRNKKVVHVSAAQERRSSEEFDSERLTEQDENKSEQLLNRSMDDKLIKHNLNPVGKEVSISNSDTEVLVKKKRAKLCLRSIKPLIIKRNKTKEPDINIATSSEWSVENNSNDLENMKINMNLKDCSVRGLYKLPKNPGEQIEIANGDILMDVVKGPMLTSPFKIVEKPPKSLLNPNETCKAITFVNKEPESSSDITLTVCSEMPSELTNVNVPLSIRTDLEVNCVNVLSPVASSMNELIPTSPVSSDTPTRNHELVSSTKELSPIKIVTKPFSIETADISITPIPSGNKSEAVSIPVSSTGSDSIYSYTVRRRRKLNSHLFERVEVPRKRGAKRKSGNVDVSNRITKMLEGVRQVETPVRNEASSSSASASSSGKEEVRNGEVEENENDFLYFVKETPPADARPSIGILKKRDSFVDSPMSTPTSCKRKHLSFKDPVSTCKFFEMPEVESKHPERNNIVDSQLNIAAVVEVNTDEPICSKEIVVLDENSGVFEDDFNDDDDDGDDNTGFDHDDHDYDDRDALSVECNNGNVDVDVDSLKMNVDQNGTESVITSVSSSSDCTNLRTDTVIKSCSNDSNNNSNSNDVGNADDGDIQVDVVGPQLPSTSASTQTEQNELSETMPDDKFLEFVGKRMNKLSETMPDDKFLEFVGKRMNKLSETMPDDKFLEFVGKRMNKLSETMPDDKFLEFVGKRVNKYSSDEFLQFMQCMMQQRGQK